MKPLSTKFRKYDSDQITVVELTSRALTTETDLNDLARYLDHLVNTHRSRRILLDLSQVRFLASAALGILVALNQRISQQGGRLVVCGLQGHVRQVFHFARLDAVLAIRTGRDEAMTSFERMTSA